MTDYEDYENNLAFPPEGDWTDTEPKNNTDRTASTIELVNKIEELNKWLDLKSEYIAKLEKKLEIAIATLELYALEKMRLRAKDGTEYELDNIGYCRAKEALMKIKELDE